VRYLIIGLVTLILGCAFLGKRVDDNCIATERAKQCGNYWVIEDHYLYVLSETAGFGNQLAPSRFRGQDIWPYHVFQNIALVVFLLKKPEKETGHAPIIIRVAAMYMRNNVIGDDNPVEVVDGFEKEKGEGNDTSGQ